MARLVVPHYSHHVVQRGHNRQRVFVRDDDFHRYLSALAKFKTEFGVKVYAWCLMTNHVHLLLASQDEFGLARLMKRLAGRQTRFYNTRAHRTGTLWESRYKSSVVESEYYLLACCRYIELNPVRAGMVDAAEEYPWSSVRARLGLEVAAYLDMEPSYLSIGADEKSRWANYRRFLNENVSPEEWERIRNAPPKGNLTGSDAFIEHVADLTGRSVEPRPRGRPSGSGVKAGK
jgi:putative transposase